MDQSLITKFSEIRKFVKDGERLRHFKGDTEVPIMYFIMKVYPQAYINFQKLLSDQYTKGYINGRNDTLKELGEKNED